MLAAVLALAVAAGAAPERYNLDCTGTVEVKHIAAKDVPPSTRPFHMVLRVDTTVMQFCEDRCEIGEPIYKLRPDKLILRSTETKGIVGDIFWISRVDGSFNRLYTFTTGTFGVDIDYNTETYTGRCSPRPFTPIPKPLF